MKAEWCYFSNYFTAEVCNQIIARCKKLPAQEGTVGVGGRNIVSNTRKSKVSFIKKDMLEFIELFDSIWKLAETANNDWFNNINLSKIDYIQFAEYSSVDRGEYQRHNDVFWVNHDPIYHRKLSVIVQLSDPSTYIGGDFEIYETDNTLPKEIIRAQGTVIIFPSFLYHAALPVRLGTRYSLAAWIEGPKWR